MKYLIVGAGFSGATLARELAEAGHSIVVIDARSHLAGNAFDYTDKNGIRVHKYGPHLYHTNNEQVHAFLSRFTEWIPYRHSVEALWSGKLVPFPPNGKTENWTHMNKEKLIDTFYRPYTLKMWGIPLEELDPDIINRVKFQETEYANEYFPNDRFQFLPKDGYTDLVKKMLNHLNIEVYLGVSYHPITKFSKSFGPTSGKMVPGSGYKPEDFDHIFTAQPIDDFYNYQFGELPYRSIKFHTTTVPAPKLYGKPVVNFTHDGLITRVTEWKQLPGHGKNKYVTTVTAEEPCDYKDNYRERYYPVKDLKGENRARYELYKAIPNEKVTFIGRTGQYVYLDMHQAINASLQLSKKIING